MQIFLLQNLPYENNIFLYYVLLKFFWKTDTRVFRVIFAYVTTLFDKNNYLMILLQEVILTGLKTNSISEKHYELFNNWYHNLKNTNFKSGLDSIKKPQQPLILSSEQSETKKTSFVPECNNLIKDKVNSDENDFLNNGHQTDFISKNDFFENNVSSPPLSDYKLATNHSLNEIEVEFGAFSPEKNSNKNDKPDRNLIFFKHQNDELRYENKVMIKNKVDLNKEALDKNKIVESTQTECDTDLKDDVVESFSSVSQKELRKTKVLNEFSENLFALEALDEKGAENFVEIKRPPTDPPITFETKDLRNLHLFSNQTSEYQNASNQDFFYYHNIDVDLKNHQNLSRARQNPMLVWNKNAFKNLNELSSKDELSKDNKKIKLDKIDSKRIWSPVFEHKSSYNYNLSFESSKNSQWNKQSNDSSNANGDRKKNLTKNEIKSKDETFQENKKYYPYDEQEKQRRQQAMQTFHAAMSQAFNLHYLRHPASFFYSPQNHFNNHSTNFDPAKMIAVAAAVVGNDSAKMNSPSESQDGKFY